MRHFFDKFSSEQPQTQKQTQTRTRTQTQRQRQTKDIFHGSPNTPILKVPPSNQKIITSKMLAKTAVNPHQILAALARSSNRGLLNFQHKKSLVGSSPTSPSSAISPNPPQAHSELVHGSTTVKRNSKPLPDPIHASNVHPFLYNIEDDNNSTKYHVDTK